eukprot:GHVS01014098.1.p1 GENE.GHVS01014098.1~~GHVS01014098.1.p1  ORF type:complete len:267 (-),score=81.18 GHVS01014098.1:256-1056(-)
MFNANSEQPQQQQQFGVSGAPTRFRGGGASTTTTAAANSAAYPHNNNDDYSSRDKPSSSSHSALYLFVLLVLLGLAVIAVPFFLKVLPFQKLNSSSNNILPEETSQQQHNYQLTTPRPYHHQQEESHPSSPTYQQEPSSPPANKKMGLDKLGYEIIRQGSSSQAVARANRVTVHAIGSVLAAPGGNKKKFWSTKDQGSQPFQYTAGVGEVIKGWDEGVLGMKQGEVRGISIPANQGYGASGFPAWGIPPNADLHFEIEVMVIETTK